MNLRNLNPIKSQSYERMRKQNKNRYSPTVYYEEYQAASYKSYNEKYSPSLFKKNSDYKMSVRRLSYNDKNANDPTYQCTRVLTTTTAIREVVCKSSFASNATFTRGTSLLEDIYSDVDTQGGLLAQSKMSCVLRTVRIALLFSNSLENDDHLINNQEECQIE